MTQAHKGTVARRGVHDRPRLVGAANATLAIIATGMSVA